MTTSALHHASKKSSKPPKISSSGIPRRTLIVIFVGLLLGILMAALDQTIVATAAPFIARDMHDFADISWVFTAYLLAQTIAMPVYGKLGDIIGRKRSFQIAIVIFLAGSVIAGLAQSMVELIACRALQGIGAGGLMIGAQTIIAEIVTARERGKYMSIMGPMIGVATVFGPLLGGYLTQHVTWRWIFYINVPIGAIAMIITGIVLKLPKTEHTKQHFDYLGTLLMGTGASCLVLLLSFGGTHFAWISPIALLLAVGTVLLGWLFIVVEKHAAAPILPPYLFKDEIFRINAPLAFLLGIAMFGAIFYLPTFLQDSVGASPTMSGVLLLPLMGGLMVAAVITGQLMSRTGRYKHFPIMGAALAAIGLGLISLMGADTSRTMSSLYMIVFGLGLGFIMPTLILLVQNSVGPKNMGTATAGVNFFRQIGASVGTALIGSLFVGRLLNNLKGAIPQDTLEKFGGKIAAVTYDDLKNFPEPIRHAYVNSYADALMPLYLYLVPVMLAAFVLVLFLKEKPLSTAIGRGPAARAAEQADSDGQATPDRSTQDETTQDQSLPAPTLPAEKPHQP